MPWDTVKLNDGHEIPTIAFGTWRIGNGDSTVQNVKTAIDTGFTHVGENMLLLSRNTKGLIYVLADTAQAYRNEVEAGVAIRQYPRDKVFVTTKWSGRDGLGAEESIHNSLKNVRSFLPLFLSLRWNGPSFAQLGIAYVDLYLIHAPQVAKPNIREAWAAMERIKDAGLARSIGVSNFNDAHLEELLKHAKYVPAANQVGVYASCYAWYAN
jgi:diketogulonate reductase-like aldo/keto reductase